MSRGTRYVSVPKRIMNNEPCLGWELEFALGENSSSSLGLGITSEQYAHNASG